MTALLTSKATRSLGFVLVLTILAFISIGQLVKPQGLTRSHNAPNGYERSGLWLWPAIDGDDFTTEDGLARVDSVRMEGYLWQGAAGQTTWQLVHEGRITVWLNDEVIFQDSEAHALKSEILEIAWDDAWLHLAIEATVDINTPRNQYPYRTQMGIYEQNLGFWSLLPAARLYPHPIENAAAQNAVLWAALGNICLGIAAFSALALLLLWFWVQRKNAGLWIILGFVLLSLILRLIVVFERFNNDPFFHFIVPAGDDNYVLMGQQWLSGQYSLAGTFWPSTPIVVFGAIVALVGSQLWKIYIANSILSAIATGAVVAAGWQAFDKKAIGILAGLLFALYPPLIFYQATPQSVVLDAFFIAFALYFGLRTIKNLSFPMAALFGICISLGAMSRGIALLLGLAFFLALMRQERIQGIKLTIVAALFAILTLLPQVTANTLAIGKFSPIPYSNGALTLYSGNNRDAEGIWDKRGMAWELARLQGGDWNAALWRDFLDSPLRMLELNLRKIAMFWNRHEYVSNGNYPQQGLGQSLLLRNLALNGAIHMEYLSFFVFMGMVLLLAEGRKEADFVNWAILFLLLGTILFVIAGRLRVPLMPALMLAAAYALHHLWESIIQRRLQRRLFFALGIAAALAFLLPIMDAELPRKDFLSLPETAIRREANFNDEIRLLGFDPIASNYTPEGYFYISLYWQSIAPTADYSVFVELADESGRIVGYDGLLGTVTYPALLSSELPNGAIIREGYLLRLPENMPPVVTVNIGLYTAEGALPLLDDEGNPIENPILTLFSIGILPHESETIAGDAITADYQFGESLVLRRYHINHSETALNLQIEWEATEQLYEDYVIFTHLLDENGAVIAQVDSPDIAANRRTSSLIPHEIYLMQREIPLPTALGTANYRLLLGLYRFPSIERLMAVDALGNRVQDDVLLIPLGE